MTTTTERVAYVTRTVRDRMGEIRVSQRENFDRYARGERGPADWKARDSELAGMSQAYASVLGMLGETLS